MKTARYFLVVWLILPAWLSITQVKTPKEEIFHIVYKPQTPPGGVKAFLRYIRKQIKYPAKARRMAIGGKVVMKFSIEKDGSIATGKVIQSLIPACDKEVMWVLKNAPKWRPGAARGVPRKVHKSIAVIFKIG